MAVNGLARELRWGNEAQETATGMGAERRVERRYQRKFLVRTTDSKDPAAVALLAPGLPPLGTPFVCGKVFDIEAHVVSRTPERQAANIWHVLVEYSTESEADEPVNRDPIMTWGFHTFQVPAVATLKQFKRKDEEPVDLEFALMSPAGEVYDPPPPRDESRPVLRITRNEKSFNPLVAIAFQDAVNATEWAHIGARQAKIMGISTTGRQSEKIRGVTHAYYPTTYEIHFKRETWDIRTLRAGSYAYKSTTDTTKVPFTAFGKPYTGLLQANGTALPSGDEPEWDEWRIYKELDFKLLHLPEKFE